MCYLWFGFLVYFGIHDDYAGLIAINIVYLLQNIMLHFNINDNIAFTYTVAPCYQDNKM